MKRNILVVALLSATALGSYQASAQSQMTAVGLAQTEEHRGSARYQGLSGAMGAVGADFSSTRQNPAGIALYRSSAKVSLTMGANNYGYQTNWYGEGYKTNGTKFVFDDFSYLSNMSWGGEGKWGFTFGFGIHNAGSFFNHLDAHTSSRDRQGNSLSDYAATRLNRLQSAGNTISPNTLGANRAYSSGYPWIGVLGHNAKWLERDGGSRYQTVYAYTDTDGKVKTFQPSDAGLLIKESGKITEYELALGIRYADWLYMGANLVMSHLDYTLFSSYQEGFAYNTNATEVDGLSLDNSLSIRGTGARLGLGLIVEPVEGFRLGASVMTPTVYSLKNDFDATATARYQPGKINQLASTPSDGASAFALRTPWRLGLSGSYIFGHRGLISLDYEYSNLGNTRLKNNDDDWDSTDPFVSDNNAISEDFGAKHTLRVGGELMLSPRFALRAGYRNTTQTVNSGYAETAQQEALVAGTLVHYSIPKGTQAFSLGFGYRLSPSWTVDVAYTNTLRKSSVYPFPAIKDNMIDFTTGQSFGSEWLSGLKAISHKQTDHRVALTLSYRFGG